MARLPAARVVADGAVHDIVAALAEPAPVACASNTPAGEHLCPCRKRRSHWSSGVLVLVDDASDPVASSGPEGFEVGYLGWKRFERSGAGQGHMSRWVLAARGSRETWAAGPLRVVTGRRCWRQVCCPCAGRRRDRFQGARWRPGCPAGACGDPGVIAVNGRRARPSGVDDGRVLPVTPCGPWRFAPGYESGGGGDLAGWVLSPSSTPIRFGFPRAVPRAASS